MESPQLKAKSFEIRKLLVYEAWKRVKANAGAPGVDAVSISRFEAEETDNLYKLWNRMSAGSYMPAAVRAVEIPKNHGKGIRVLGVPNVADRIAQTAAAMLLEEKLEPIFHPDSYGYRPGRSAHDALAVTRKRCWAKNWVIDLDIRAFFDSVDHDLLLKAVAHHTDEQWVLLYIERWLKAPMKMPDGTLVEREKGTPQGSPISPLLANLFMHYAFDRWMDREHPGLPFGATPMTSLSTATLRNRPEVCWARLAERLDGPRPRVASRQDEDRVLQGHEAPRRVAADQLRFPRLHLSGTPRLGPKRTLHGVLAGHQHNGKKGDRPQDQGLASQTSQWHRPVRSRLGDQPPGPRLDQLLESAGINRHGEGDERALHRRSSDPR